MKSFLRHYEFFNATGGELQGLVDSLNMGFMFHSGWYEVRKEDNERVHDHYISKKKKEQDE